MLNVLTNMYDCVYLFLLQIAMLSGVMDIHLLFCIYGLTATTMLFGLLQEQMTAHQWGKPEEKSMLAFWLGTDCAHKRPPNRLLIQISLGRFN